MNWPGTRFYRGTPAYLKILDYFGPEVLCPDKTLDRKRLRDAITRDPEKKQMLEQFRASGSVCADGRGISEIR